MQRKRKTRPKLTGKTPFQNHQIKSKVDLEAKPNTIIKRKMIQSQTSNLITVPEAGNFSIQFMRIKLSTVFAAASNNAKGGGSLIGVF